MRQIQVELTDEEYDAFERRALDSGLKSVDELVSAVIAEELAEGLDSLDYLFTPERIVHIDNVLERVRSGGATYSVEQASAYLAENRKNRISKNSK